MFKQLLTFFLQQLLRIPPPPKFLFWYEYFILSISIMGSRGLKTELLLLIKQARLVKIIIFIKLILFIIINFIDHSIILNYYKYWLYHRLYILKV